MTNCRERTVSGNDITRKRRSERGEEAAHTIIRQEQGTRDAKHWRWDPKRRGGTKSHRQNQTKVWWLGRLVDPDPGKTLHIRCCMRKVDGN